MDRLFAEQCRIEPISVPKGLTGIDHAYRVCNDAFYPATRTGDILCCAEMPCPGLPWPSLAIVYFPQGYYKLTRYKPDLSRILRAATVRFIIKD